MTFNLRLKNDLFNISISLQRKEEQLMKIERNKKESTSS